MSNRWTTCWKCEKDIKTKKDCNYVKTRDIDISLCPKCYKDFKQTSKDFLRLEKLKVNSIYHTVRNALFHIHEEDRHSYDFDECKRCEKGLRLLDGNTKDLLKELMEDLSKDNSEN